MSTLKRWVFPLLALLLVASGTSWAQTCPPIDDALEEALLKAVASKALLIENAETPLATAPADQIAAPSSAGGGGLVNLPGFASLLGLAQEQGLIDNSNGVTTISLTPYSFLALLRPQYSYDQELYDDVWWTRRLGGQVAFGGKGDSFDRDGDGTADEALVAKDPNDIVTWEVKYQFGSRDRRDRKVYQEYFNQISARAQENSAAYSAAVLEFRKALGGKISALKEGECLDPADIQNAFKQPVMVSALKKLAASDADLKKFQEDFEDVDQKPILTLVYGGTERKDEFGADKRSAALRGAFTMLGGTNSVELSWAQVESLLEVNNAVTWKLGYDYSRNFLKGTDLLKDGMTLAVAGSYEMLQDVPMAKHDTNSKVNAKLSIPLMRGVEVPISVTWANHKDLLTDEEEIRGHIGFTVDYSKIRDQILGKK